VKGKRDKCFDMVKNIKESLKMPYNKEKDI
jgi:hypothetical protein